MHISINKDHISHQITQENKEIIKILPKISLRPKITKTRNQSDFLNANHNVGVIGYQKQYYYHLWVSIQPKTTQKIRNSSRTPSPNPQYRKFKEKKTRNSYLRLCNWGWRHKISSNQGTRMDGQQISTKEKPRTRREIQKTEPRPRVLKPESDRTGRSV